MNAANRWRRRRPWAVQQSFFDNLSEKKEEDVDGPHEETSPGGEEEGEEEDTHQVRQRRTLRDLVRGRSGTRHRQRNDNDPSSYLICARRGRRCYSSCIYSRPHQPKHVPQGSTTEELLADIRSVKCPIPYRNRRMPRRFVTLGELDVFHRGGEIPYGNPKIVPDVKAGSSEKSSGPRTRYEILIAKFQKPKKAVSVGQA